MGREPHTIVTERIGDTGTKAGRNIDRLLGLACWSAQSRDDLDHTASSGVTHRTFPLEAGFAEYILFVDRVAIGFIETKEAGTILGGGETQSEGARMACPISCRLSISHHHLAVRNNPCVPTWSGDSKKRGSYRYHYRKTLWARPPERQTKIWNGFSLEQ